MQEPTTFAELFDFYQNRVKLFYSAVQAGNELPTEILFEINAAFDHISRYHVYGQSEEEVVGKAYSHLKRACLDVFKIILRDTLFMVAELEKLDISLIDNGKYEKDLKALEHSIKKRAIEARRKEGDPMTAEADLEVPAFALWLPVFEDCLKLQDDFYHHPAVDWAKKKGRWMSTKALVVSVLASALVGALLTKLLEALIG